MRDYQITKKASKASWLVDLLLLTLLIAILFGSFLGSRPLMTPDEGRYAEISREMVATGDYITPHLNYIKYFEKPPLFYWLEAAPIKLFGMSEWSLRLAPAVLGLLGCLFVYITSRKLFDRRTGILASLVLATSVLYFAMTHFITPDIALTVFLTSSLLSFIVAVHEARGWRHNCWLWAMYALAACAVLTKGLIGVIFPGTIIFLWLCVQNEWRQLPTYRLPSGLLLFLFLAVPWHLLVQHRNPEFFRFFIIEQQFLRYFTHYANREQPLWFFPTVVAIGFFPWLCFLLATIFGPKKHMQSTSFSVISNQLNAHNVNSLSYTKDAITISQKLKNFWVYRRQHHAVIFLAIWVGVILLFFMFSKSLLISYALPLMPPLAILIARRLSLSWEVENSSETRLGFALFLIIASAMCLIGLILITPAEPIYWWISVSLLLLSAVLATLLYWYRGIKAGVIGLMLGVSACLISCNLSYPTLDLRSIKPLVTRLQPLLQPNTQVASYRQYYQDLPFYLQRRVIVVDFLGELQFGTEHQDARSWIMDKDTFWHLWSQEPRMFVLMGLGDYNALQQLNKKNRPSLYPVTQNSTTILLTNQPL